MDGGGALGAGGVVVVVSAGDGLDVSVDVDVSPDAGESLGAGLEVVPVPVLVFEPVFGVCCAAGEFADPPGFAAVVLHDGDAVGPGFPEPRPG